MPQEFVVRFNGEVVIELSDDLINSINDDWRASFYDLQTPQDIACHIAYNFIINKFKLSEMDGFADQPFEAAIITEGPAVYFE